VNTASEYLKPYAKLVTVRGAGNHESAIHKNHETNLVERLTERIRANGGIARRGGYSGYVRFHIYNGKRQNNSLKLWYFHGSGGGGPVTRGVIQTNRQSVYVSDADIIATGHVHESWQVAVQRIRFNQVRSSSPRTPDPRQDRRLQRRIRRRIRRVAHRDRQAAEANWSLVAANLPTES
jgi:hypothetical protein